MASTATMRLTLLGGFALRQGDQEMRIAERAQRLVALLALRARPLGRLHVAGILWPDYSTARSLADLRTALWRANQSGEKVVIATASHLALHGDIEVDVHKLVAFAQRLNDPALGQIPGDRDSVGLAELSSDLLPDWYDEWLQDEREALRQLRLHALEALARALSATGRHADAIQAALSAIALEPLRETAHRILIETHLAEGNRGEAFRQFRRCQRLLRDELGVEPSESMRRLLEGLPELVARPRGGGRGEAPPSVRNKKRVYMVPVARSSAARASGGAG